MTTSESTIYDLAGEAYRWFERTKRADGTEYVRLKGDHPAWIQEAVYDAHGDMLPDDWKYACIQSAFGWIHDNEPSEDDLEDGHEFADSEVDVYNANLFAWLSSHLQRQFYVDEAVEELGIDVDDFSIARTIMLGQYMEACEVYASVVKSLREQIEDQDDGTDDDE